MTPTASVADRTKTFTSVFNVFTRYKAWMARGGVDDVEICVGSLYQAVESYYLDLERLKSAHNITLEDEHKQAAFMIKWLVKLRPVQYPAIRVDVGKKRALANEILALHVAFTFLRVKPGLVPAPLYDNLLYFLHYRYADDERGLALMMYMLQQIVERTSTNRELREQLNETRLRVMTLEARLT